MGQSYFIFNGRDCREMGVRLTSPMPIIRPEERVEHIQIPGRAGDLTRTEGDDVYNSYIQTATISVPENVNVRHVYDWLRGSGYLITSSEPDRRQMARVIGAITLNKVSKYLDRWTGEVQFYCQPLKELLWEPVVEISTAGTVKNNGDVVCHPLIQATASAATMVISTSWTEGSSTGHSSITVTGLESDQVIWIDSDTMEVMNEGRSTLLTSFTTGAFPRLRPGDNSVGGSGWSKLVIQKRERYL